MTDTSDSLDQPSGFTAFVTWLMSRGMFDYGFFSAWGASLTLLAARVWLALPFYNAGMARVNDWPSQPFYFADIHPVPYLPPDIAALVTTIGELGLAGLLVLGLFGRFAGLGLGVMAAVIYFVVGQTETGLANGIANLEEQLPWMVVGAHLFFTGPGRLSLDYILRRTLIKA